MDTELRDRLNRVEQKDRESARAEQEAAVEAVRRELRKDYEAARTMVAQIEQAAPALLREAGEYHSAGARCGVASDQFNRYYSEINAMLHGGFIDKYIQVHPSTTDMRTGLAAYEQLTFDKIKGPNARAIFLRRTGDQLRRGDGVLYRVRSLLGQMKTDLKAWVDSRA
jgi:hypothetical protein